MCIHIHSYSLVWSAIKKDQHQTRDNKTHKTRRWRWWYGGFSFFVERMLKHALILMSVTSDLTTFNGRTSIWNIETSQFPFGRNWHRSVPQCVCVCVLRYNVVTSFFSKNELSPRLIDKIWANQADVKSTFFTTLYLCLTTDPLFMWEFIQKCQDFSCAKMTSESLCDPNG